MNNESRNEIKKAVSLLKAGDIVALPTETVYGLGARVTDDMALRKIFLTKERPFFDPLIVHVKSVEQARQYSGNWGEAHSALAKAFWPGPMTLILEKRNISDLISSGLQTVGLRMPNNSLFLEIIEQLGEPIAAPSANKFGKTSPTTAQHVQQEFGPDLFVVDGGACQVGIESTILKVTEDDLKIHVTVLRSGILTPSEIVDCLKVLNREIEIHQPGKNIEAPGQVEHHYMPNVPIIFWSHRDTYSDKELKKKFPQFPQVSELVLSESPELAARELYSKMRSVSNTAQAIVFVKKDFHAEEKWAGIMDRLWRASSFKN